MIGLNTLIYHTMLSFVTISLRTVTPILVTFFHHKEHTHTHTHTLTHHSHVHTCTFNLECVRAFNRHALYHTQKAIVTYVSLNYRLITLIFNTSTLNKLMNLITLYYHT